MEFYSRDAFVLAHLELGVAGIDPSTDSNKAQFTQDLQHDKIQPKLLFAADLMSVLLHNNDSS